MRRILVGSKKCATPRGRRARRRRGNVPPGTLRGCARQIPHVARGSALRCTRARNAQVKDSNTTHTNRAHKLRANITRNYHNHNLRASIHAHKNVPALVRLKNSQFSVHARAPSTTCRRARDSKRVGAAKRNAEAHVRDVGRRRQRGQVERPPDTYDA